MNTEIEKDIQNDYFSEKKIEESIKAQKAHEILRIFHASQKTPTIHIQHFQGNKDPMICDFSFLNNRKEETAPRINDAALELPTSKLKK